jgi:hypothetical protein
MLEFNQSRINHLEAHIPNHLLGRNLIVGIPDNQTTALKIKQAGLTHPLVPGEILLPRIIGPISRFNSYGKEIPIKTEPKETLYRQQEFTRQEWRGRGETEEVTSFVWIPYERYPRRVINPPGIELIVATSGGNIDITTASLTYSVDTSDRLKHSINLFLELFGKCYVYETGARPRVVTREIRLNWKLLPPGVHPWDRIKTAIADSLTKQPSKSLAAAFERFERINDLSPDFRATGQGGYRGYVVFGFEAENLYVLESQFPNNAIYVFGSDWAALSLLTKAEIIQGERAAARIIHTPGWYQTLRRILNK